MFYAGAQVASPVEYAANMTLKKVLLSEPEAVALTYVTNGAESRAAEQEVLDEVVAGINPIVTLEKQVLNTIGNLV